MGLDAEITWDLAPWEDMIKSIKTKWDDVGVRDTFGSLVAVHVYKDIMDHFEQEKAPEGRWKAWSDSYAEHMRKVGKGGNKILQDSGRLRMSFTPARFRSSKDSLTFYNPAKTKDGFGYAAAHDQGGKKLPRRQFMWISDKAMDAIIDSVQRWLNPTEGDSE